MPMYLISYDLKRTKDYPRLLKVLRDWKSARVLESLWLSNLKGNAMAVLTVLRVYVDSDDALVVIELAPNFDWAALRGQTAGVLWLQRHSP